MKEKWISILLCLLFNGLALLVMLWPLLDHGFPLLYSDSGTYMAAAYDGIIPIDRPMAYSWFVRLSAFLFTMQFAVIMQGILILYTSYLFVHKGFFPSLPVWLSGLIMAFLALFTGMPHLVSQIMPDVFTGLLFLLILLWVNKARLAWYHQVFIALSLLFLVAVHTSHLLLFILVYPLMLLVYGWFLKKWQAWRGVWIFGPVFLIVPMINQWTDGRFFYSDSSRIFLIASLQTAGVLEPWLDKHCGEPEAPAFLCRNKEELRGKDGNYILWGSTILTDTSCENKAGWAYCWKLRNEELASFVKSWWKDPEARQIWLKNAWKATWAQFLDFEIGFIKSQKEGSPPYFVLESRYPKMLIAYKASDQYKEDLHFNERTRVQDWTVKISSILLLVLVFYGWKRGIWKKEWTLILLGLLAFLLLNAFVCGVFSNPVNRYQARVIWLIPFFTALFSALFLRFFIQSKQNDEEYTFTSRLG